MSSSVVASPGFLSFVLMVEFLLLLSYVDCVILPAQTFNLFTGTALLCTVLTVTVYNANFALSQVSFLSHYNLSSLQDDISGKGSSNLQYYVTRASMPLCCK